MTRILLVDASPLIYATYEKVGHLSTSTGEPTGLRYGFLRSLASYKKKLKTEKVVVVFDMPGKKAKSEGIAEYKANRVFTEEKRTMYGQIPDLRKMLELTNYTTAHAEGYEADDVVGAIARTKGRLGDEVFILSTDNDLCQVVDKNVQIFVPAKAAKGDRKATKDQLLGPNDVADKLGVFPCCLLIYRSVVGDVSDNLAGVPGMTTALQNRLKESLNQGPQKRYEPETLLDSESGVLDGEMLNYLVQHSEIIKKNYRVMTLDTPKEVTVVKGSRDGQALRALFEKLEFKSMMDRVEEFTE